MRHPASRPRGRSVHQFYEVKRFVICLGDWGRGARRIRPDASTSPGGERKPEAGTRNSRIADFRDVRIGDWYGRVRPGAVV